MKRPPASSQLWLFAEGELPHHPPRFTPYSVAFILECVAAYERNGWAIHPGGMRENLRAALIPFNNMKGLTGEIEKVIRGDYPMPPDFREEVEKLRPQEREKLPFK